MQKPDVTLEMSVLLCYPLFNRKRKKRKAIDRTHVPVYNTQKEQAFAKITEDNMKKEETENAAIHAELDRQILELLRQMTPERRAESIEHIKNTYGNNAGR